jgi:hypothetical protein
MYEHLVLDDSQISRNEFDNRIQTWRYEAQIEDADIEVLPNTTWSTFSPRAQVDVVVTYHLRNLDDYTYKTTLVLVRQENTWRIDWDWDNFLPILTKDSRIETKILPVKRGDIYHNGELIVSDVPSYMISIIPEELDKSKENELLQFISTRFSRDIKEVHLHQRYTDRYLSSLAIPIGVIPNPDAETVRTLSSYPGVVLTPAFARLVKELPDTNIGTVTNTHFAECCSFLYNTTTYGGKGGLEETYNNTLKGQNGGTLRIKDEHDKTIKVLLEVPIKNGRDVHL